MTLDALRYYLHICVCFVRWSVENPPDYAERAARPLPTNTRNNWINQQNEKLNRIPLVRIYEEEH